MGWKSIAVGVAGLMLASQPALATTQTFTLSVLDPASGVGTGPFGTVTVTENVGGTLTFSQSLLPGFGIHDTTSANHQAFYFSIINDPALTFTNLTSGFAVLSNGPGNVSAPPFSDFYTAITCVTACGHGAPGYQGTLSFTVGASSALTLTSLRSTAFGVNPVNSIYFASDLVNANGRTGNVGAVLQQSAVPEPATWGMMLIGFAGMGIALRRRRRAEALAAA